MTKAEATEGNPIQDVAEHSTADEPDLETCSNDARGASGGIQGECTSPDASDASDQDSRSISGSGQDSESTIPTTSKRTLVDQEVVSSVPEEDTNNSSVEIIEGTHKLSAFAESKQAHNKYNDLGESSRRTAKTVSDMSGSDWNFSASESQGTKMRLSTSTRPRISSSSSPQRSTRQRSQAQSSNSPYSSFEVQSLDTTTRSDVFPMVDASLSNDQSQRQHQELMEQEERKHQMCQIIFCLVFTLCLFGGGGIVVYLQIQTNS